MDNNKELIAIIISIGTGIFAILASILDWDFFFENKKAKLFMKIFGRTGSRVFYTLLGLLLFFLAFKIITQ